MPHALQHHHLLPLTLSTDTLKDGPTPRLRRGFVLSTRDHEERDVYVGVRGWRGGFDGAAVGDVARGRLREEHLADEGAREWGGRGRGRGERDAVRHGFHAV